MLLSQGLNGEWNKQHNKQMNIASANMKFNSESFFHPLPSQKTPSSLQALKMMILLRERCKVLSYVGNFGNDTMDRIGWGEGGGGGLVEG